MHTLILINIWSVVFFGLLTIGIMAKVGVKKVSITMIFINAFCVANLVTLLYI